MKRGKEKQLNFHMSTMGGGKTLEIILEQHRQTAAGYSTLLAKPSVDTKAEDHIHTRFGDIKKSVDVLLCPMDDVYEKLCHALGAVATDAIIYVDEAQFLTPEQVASLRRLADDDIADVEAYGLLTNFRGEFFDGSDALVRLADNKIQIPSYCEHDSCGRTALFNARFVDGTLVSDGPVVAIDGQDASYMALCSRHYKGQNS